MSETISELPQETQTQPESEIKSEIQPELNQEIRPTVEVEAEVKPEITPQQEKKNSTAKKIVNNVVQKIFPPVTSSETSQCVGYKFRWVDLILPPYEVLDTLCSSKDKTYMTIYTLIRLLILGIISFALYKYLPRDPVTETIIYLFIALVIVNLIFLGVIISKTPINSSNVTQEVKSESS